MISSLILSLLMQSATPFGSPVDPILRPSESGAKESTNPPLRQSKNPADIRFEQCLDQAAEDPGIGLLTANKWQIEGGTYLARNCLGFAYSGLENWTKAIPEFVESAEGARAAGDERAGIFWSQAGNAALAAGDHQLAMTYLSAALEQASLDGLLKGEVHLDMARVLVALDRYDEARQKFSLVHKLVPQDPLGWLLSATLARRMGDLGLAKSDIAKAAQLAATDPAVALEAGNIAYEAGDTVNAKVNWLQAVKFGPDSPSAKAATRYLDQLASSVDD